MRCMLLILGLLAVFAILFPIHGGAQLGPNPGERVRIRHTDGAVWSGVLGSVSAEDVRLLPEGSDGRELVIPRAEIDQIEKYLGEHRSFWRNFGITMGVSSVGIGTLSAVLWTPCTETGFLACFLYPSNRGEALVWGLAGGAFLGVPVGVLVGLIKKNERWEDFPLSGSRQASLSIQPIVGRRIGFSASLALGGQ